MSLLSIKFPRLIKSELRCYDKEDVPQTHIQVPTTQASVLNLNKEYEYKGRIIKRGDLIKSSTVRLDYDYMPPQRVGEDIELFFKLNPIEIQFIKPLDKRIAKHFFNVINSEVFNNFTIEFQKELISILPSYSMYLNNDSKEEVCLHAIKPLHDFINSYDDNSVIGSYGKAVFSKLINLDIIPNVTERVKFEKHLIQGGK